MSLFLQTGQDITEPVTLSDVKGRISLVTTDDDSKVTAIISAAREFAERISNRSLTAPKTYIQYLEHGFPAPREAIKLLISPLVAVTSIEYLTEDDSGNDEWLTWDSSEYRISTGNVPPLIRPKAAFIYPVPVRAPGSVRVTFTAGMTELPKHWALNLQDIAVFMYENAGVKAPDSLVLIPRVTYW